MRIDSLNQERLSTSCSATFWQLAVFRATFGDSEQFLVARIRTGTISDLKASWDWSEGQNEDQQTWRTKRAVFKTVKNILRNANNLGYHRIPKDPDAPGISSSVRGTLRGGLLLSAMILLSLKTLTLISQTNCPPV